jgi:hypothetical protein
VLEPFVAHAGLDLGWSQARQPQALGPVTSVGRESLAHPLVKRRAREFRPAHALQVTGDQLAPAAHPFEGPGRDRQARRQHPQPLGDTATNRRGQHGGGE